MTGPVALQPETAGEQPNVDIVHIRRAPFVAVTISFGLGIFIADRAEVPLSVWFAFVGAGLAVHLPTGRYYEDRLINLGNNRYTFRPQLGVVHTRDKWSMELTGSTWFFTDNDDFYNGKLLESDPLYAVQGHAVYTFRPGLSLAGGLGYGYGAESKVDGDRKDDRKENLAWGLSLSYPLTRQLGVKVGYLGTRPQASVGADTDTVVGALAFLW